MDHLIVWFEIPVKDLKRAMKFYSQILDIELKEMEMGPAKMAFFPFSESSISGSLIEAPDYQPGENGPVIYLNGGEDLSIPLDKIEVAGGKILQQKMSIGEHGFIATFKDTEGNRVALHSKH